EIDTDVGALLEQQITAPVRFQEAITAASQDIALFIEVGPGSVLGSLASDIVPTPIVSLDAGGPSISWVLKAAEPAFALGAPVNHRMLFEDRTARPFDLDWKSSFLPNPCELAPLPGSAIGAEGIGHLNWADAELLNSPRNQIPLDPVLLQPGSAEETSQGSHV